VGRNLPLHSLSDLPTKLTPSVGAMDACPLAQTRFVPLQFPEQAGQKGLENRRRSRRGQQWSVSVKVDPWAIASLGSLIVNYLVVSAKFGAVSAAGFLTIIGVHEMGHMVAARLVGVSVHWPIFIPGVGAFVSWNAKSGDAFKRAFIGIGGPIAGVAATLVLHWVAVRFDSEDLKDVAWFGYSVHLMNLIPAGVLDGGHIAEFVGRWMWVPGAALLGWVVLRVGEVAWYARLIIGLMMMTAIWRALVVLLWRPRAGEKGISGRGKRLKRTVMCLGALLLVAVCLVGLAALTGRL